MLWLLIAVPLVVGTALLLAGRTANRIAPSAGMCVAVVTLVLASLTAVRRPGVSAALLDGVPFGLRVDGLSSVMVVTVAVVLLAVLVFATGEFAGTETSARFFGLMLLFAGAMLVTVTATTLLSLLMAWEVMGAASYALIGFWWRDSRRVDSGKIAFLTTRGADLGLYLAAGAALAGGAGGLALNELSGLPPGWRDVVTAGVVLAALGKSAQLPFSFWLSRAMDGPSPVSAMLHSATMVAAGAYLLLRLEPLLSATAWAGALVAWAGVLTALALGAVAVVQQDLKQLLAASTCAQVGFMVLAAGLGAVAAGSGHLLAHALTKSLLFLTAGAWLAALGTKSLPALRGVARRYPVVGISFTVGAVVLAGIPPLSIWATKDRVLAAAVHESAPLYLAGLAAAALSAAYAGRAVALVWSAVPSTESSKTEKDGSPRGSGRITDGQWLALPPLAAGAAILGVLAVPRVWAEFSGAIGAPGEPAPRWWEVLVSAIVALSVAGMAATVVRRRGDVPDQPKPREWFGLETLATRAVAAPLLGTARALARFDDRVVDGGVRATARFTALLARGANLRVEHAVDTAVRLVARSFRGLGSLARRPQTGQSHHYYAQAVVALAALAALLAVLR
ncbi:NADH:ubiquinone oxidoreductase subunit 5 (chain L)/Multisubunit Na+/H+ antiporter, MnhA subunit [Amycolatopsis marina]|uniref:NADH:ubiquinone oxidoreductase subunit 5 (Chain L)/Multisubunit Na+/H+ antiporter, MnhA subunit n=1 Tax=Amycolatopsis marina TaxID=490629 RepID=A0A1I0XY71_9PSEU|nr:proton-conducting transporter membrane subunit [Amycolatopsis marina]SFB05985.1 NADH:ubiquinone oxidoreductase subunit 5 (chain L)/Multisubunit Na+/H+ antiporter, MnhA subunit [Amycolatopsis marina]